MQKQSEKTFDIEGFERCNPSQIPANQKQKEALEDLLLNIYEQSKDSNFNMEITIEQFRVLYKKNPKFQKSKIYQCIVDIRDKHHISLEAIAEICESIYKAELVSSKEGTEGKFVKWLDRMVDNINLEIARQNYLVSIEGKLQGMGNSLENKNKQIEKLEDDIKETTRNHIVILGIFASIILTAISGLVFTTSVLSNIDKSSIYRLVFIVCLIALLISNTLNYLFRFINGFNKNNIETKPPSCIHYFIQRLNWFNIIIFVIIGLNGLAWFAIEKYRLF